MGFKILERSKKSIKEEIIATKRDIDIYINMIVLSIIANINMIILSPSLTLSSIFTQYSYTTWQNIWMLFTTTTIVLACMLISNKIILKRLIIKNMNT